MTARAFGFYRHRPSRPSPHLFGYHDASRREVTKAFKDKALGEVWLAERHVAQAMAIGAPIDATTTLDAWWSHYIGVTKLKPSSQATYVQLYRTHIAPTFGRLPLADISKQQVQRWVDRLPLAPSTAVTVLRVLQASLNAAVDEEVLLRSPARKIEPPKVRRTRVTIPPADVIDKLAEVICSRYRVTVWLAADAGLRQGEVLGLQWSDVDFDAAMIHVVRQAQTVAGLGVLVDQSTKSDAGVRSVPISDRLLEELKLHHEQYGGHELIVTSTTGAAVRRNLLHEHWQKACREVNVEIRYHDLRHRFASTLLAAGLTLFEVKVLMGHSSIEETSNTYGHLVHGHADRVRAALSTKED